MTKKPWRSEKYKSWVRTLPCSHCGTDYSVVAHHIIGCGYGLGGTSTKADDSLSMSMCVKCHDCMHNGAIQKSKQILWVSETLKKAMRYGIISEFEVNDDIETLVAMQNAFRSGEVKFLKRG